jgi:hypothetical protein
VLCVVCCVLCDMCVFLVLRLVDQQLSLSFGILRDKVRPGSDLCLVHQCFACGRLRKDMGTLISTVMRRWTDATTITPEADFLAWLKTRQDQWQSLRSSDTNTRPKGLCNLLSERW